MNFGHQSCGDQKFSIVNIVMTEIFGHQPCDDQNVFGHPSLW
jgi:hypothetical protein